MRTRTPLFPAVLAAATTVVVGCTVGPDYHEPKAQTKAAWPMPVTPATRATTRDAEADAGFTTDGPVQERWWTAFGDPAIDALVDRAVRQNLDVAVAGARVRQSRAARAVTASGQDPGVNADGAYDYYHRAGPLAPAIPGDYQWYQVGFDAAWELDVFGGIRRSIESATAAYQASVDEARGVRLSLVAEVVRDYVELRTAQRRLQLAEQNLRYQEKTLALTRERFNAGVVGDLDVHRAESLVSNTRAGLPPLEDRALAAVRSLSVLMAEEPDAMASMLRTTAPIPPPPGRIAVGLPGDLLRRRPDIRSAERQLASANARIGEATANLYPRFSLLGGIGQLDVQTDKFFDWSRRYAAIGPQMSWDLFDAGKTRAQIDGERAATGAALARYQKAVLVALAEVENAMTSLDSEHRRHGDLADAVVADRKAVARATEFYLQGITDFTTVLDGERSLAAAEDALAVSSQAIDDDAVSLWKALGGGWAATEPGGSARHGDVRLASDGAAVD